MKKSLSIFLLLFTILSYGQRARIYSTEAGAIDGYDPVAYFKEGKPMRGNESFTLEWKDAKWYFTSQENLETFSKDPDKFAPQYGGYCAFGTSRGYKASTKADAFTIYDGKLYLNYDKSVVEIWGKKKEEFIKKADENWKEIESK